MSDPFARYETLARGGIPAAPPQPAQPEAAPRTAVVDGIKISADRLDALVWALTELLVDGARAAQPVKPISMDGPSPWKIT